MSLHIEWDTVFAEIQLFPQGTEFPGYEEPITEDFGVLIGGAGGGAIMLEGSLDQLLAFAGRLRTTIERQRINDKLDSITSDAIALSNKEITTEQFHARVRQLIALSQEV